MQAGANGADEDRFHAGGGEQRRIGPEGLANVCRRLPQPASGRLFQHLHNGGVSGYLKRFALEKGADGRLEGVVRRGQPIDDRLQIGRCLRSEGGPASGWGA